MKATGIVLLVIGAIALFIAFIMDTTVATGLGSERVHNIGLMNDRQNIIIVSGVLAVIGAIFLGFARKDLQPIESAIDNSQDRTCPYCAETIKAAATICRFCRKELKPIEAPSAATRICGELNRPPGMPISNWRESLMTANGIETKGDGYVWNGTHYDSFDMVVAAMRQQKT